MTVGTVGFVSERLKQAREARALTITALADLVEVSSTAISQYEKGVHVPKEQVVRRLASKLNLPFDFFLKPMSSESGTIYYRSISTATKQARRRAERRLEWLKEAIIYLSQYVDFPQLNIPHMDIPDDFRELDSEIIENAAQTVRDAWNLDTSPIANVVHTLEANGIFVSRGALAAETLDSLSECLSDGRLIFLNSEKSSQARSRFDASHELGHLVLHRKVSPKSLNKTSEHKLIEDQAHLFASSFLLPGREFSNSLWAPTLDGFRSIKSRWKVSIAAMIVRSRQLQIISDDEARRLWINLNRRGWRKHEPLDDLPVEQPMMLRKAMQLLVDHNVKSREQILSDLSLSPSDAEELLGLERGYLGEAENPTDPVLKSFDNVIAFRR